ncbi:microtubule-associated tumor suppressor candidate 2 isoform X2 [Oryzias melastigma]|uniref:microtubule-associated tumor suppressor candidate 2 isoform X2 n=1 Tax=Oryzias melastigma TaxID=30732 RepID=UPI000CF7CCCD|nr:microtubule-associated tumor suppressor candidate 2 isoform X2 [Oryzias melastigma]
MCERGKPFANGELQNNNPRGAMPAAGDANANEIQAEDGRGTGDGDSLLGLMADTSERDKVIIWGTDSQCDDPELAEFEMLECQELEAYLVEEEEDFVGLAERKELLEQPLSEDKASVRQAGDASSQKEKNAHVDVTHQQKSSLAEIREESRTDLSSENEAFVTCLSSISSIATATQMTESWHAASGPHSEDVASQTCGTVSESSLRPDPSLFSTKKQRDFDMNLNCHSEDALSQGEATNLLKDVSDKHKGKNETGNSVSGVGDCTDASSSAKESKEESNSKRDKSTQADETPDLIKAAKTGTPSSAESKTLKKQGSFDNSLKKQSSFDRSFKKQPSFENTLLKKQLSFDNSLKKQGSFEKTSTSNSSSLERRKPWGSPSRPAAPGSPKTGSCSPRRRPSGSPAKVQSSRAVSLERSDCLHKNAAPPLKTSVSCSGIPKPVTCQQKDNEPEKPKNVRPKIITYVRKSTQPKPQDEPSTRLPSHHDQPAQNDSKAFPQSRSTPVLSSSNLLFDKYRQEMQKAGYTGVSGVKPPSTTVPMRPGGKSASFHGEMSRKYLHEHVPQDGGVLHRSPRTLRPQLGLGAVTRQPVANTRLQHMGQKAANASCQSTQAAKVPPLGNHDLPGQQKSSGPETTPKSLLLKSGQSGLRPPGFSALPVSRLAAFGFIRSSSISSVSSDSSQGDPCRSAQLPSCGGDGAPPQKAAAPQSKAAIATSRPQPPNAPSMQRRSLPTQPSSPFASRKEFQKDTESAASPKSSPKRFAVVSPKLQSPARGQTAVSGAVRTVRAQQLDRALIQQLQERCDQQALQLQSLQAQLKKASLCLDVFSITTQHFCHKSESAVVRERELSLELAKIRDEVAFNVARWEQLQQEKEDLERRFEEELQGLRTQQQRELGALEERLKVEHLDETEKLQAQQRAELEELQFRQQEQLEEMTESHETSLMEMETTHNDTMATLQEEHARTVKNLKMAHEQQKKSLEEEFEKIRLSLQDQVDTLTFQNRSLRDRAKRFEEALRRSTDEQIVDALAPYKHIEEDLKSLKEVLEMKNQQIHQQELKIAELEKIAAKNVYLEEKLQVLQQQNEDLKERIDKNVAVSRQLSKENANLQVNVEKESNEKKRLSRTNEELLWRLQTGELSPRMSPTGSPIHRPSSGPGSPARPHSYHQ